MAPRSLPWVVLVVGGLGAALGVDPEAAEEASSCFSSASVVGAVLGTLVVLVALEAGAYLLWRLYWSSRRGQHLVLVTDPEKGGEYAFDNPCFKDATPVSKAMLDPKEPGKLEQKNKWTSWSGLGAMRNNLGGLQGEKRRAMDDSHPTEPQVSQVSLRSHDFTGLGFNICGNMRDGIFVKDVLHRGPASESGRIFPGDRIHGIRISLRHMVFEDALTILSYASPYEVTLDVEAGTGAQCSRPSSLLRRDREMDKEPVDHIVHPFYRSQSIADLAQIGKGSQKRGNDSRSETSNEYPTLKLLHTSVSPSTAPRVERMHTSTPLVQGRDHVRLENTAAVIAPSSNVVVKPGRKADGTAGSPSRMHKVGIRVLPTNHPTAHPEHTEKRQNVHNAYLERGIDVPDGYNPYLPASRTSAPPAGFDDVDLGATESGAQSHEEVDAHHKVGVVAKEVKTKISKGIHNLLHSLDRKKSTAKDETESPPARSPPASSQSPPTPLRSPAAESPEQQKQPAEEVMVRKPSGRGIPTEIPEEVRLAAMAARSNRKSLGAPLSIEVLDSPTEAKTEQPPRAASRNSSGSGASGAKRKGMAPRPPATPTTTAPLTPTTATRDESPPSSPMNLVNGGDDVEALHSDSDSEMESAGPRTTIELTASHITIHHSPCDEETTRKAASLGDLSRIEDKLPTVTILERAVSLDLVDGTPLGPLGTPLGPLGGKKRKAPPAPTLEDDDLLVPDLDDANASRKEPRLDLTHGHSSNTFERSRLKKSSDWGTLEEALNTPQEQVFVLTAPAAPNAPTVSTTSTASTAPTVAEVIHKGELKNSFFVGMKFSQGQEEHENEPFSFTATMEPLSIEVRSETSPTSTSSSTPASTPTSTPTSTPVDSSERDKVLWSRVSVNATPPPAEAAPDAVLSANSGPASGPASGPSSLSIVSSTPLHPRRPTQAEPHSTTDDSMIVNTSVQSPLISSSDASCRPSYVTTTQLNSLEDTDMDTRSEAFLTAVDSTLLDDSAPDLPTSPVPVSSPLNSLTSYITEIQVTTPDCSSVHNGVQPSDSSHSMDEAPTPTPTPGPVETPDRVTSAPSQPKMNGCSDPDEERTPVSCSEAAPISPASSPASSTPSSSTTTPKVQKNVSVTAIQGSRIPVRSTSQEDRQSRTVTVPLPVSPSAVSRPRPPVPARRSADLSPRKANGVQVVTSHPSDH